MRHLLELPAEQIDLAKAKLTLDRLIDPRINDEDALRQIDAMVEGIRALIPAGAIDVQKAAALQLYLYSAGEWNGHRPFSYDLDDPFGKNIRNKLLTTYLETRRGNCVSMPILTVILAQRLGLEMTLAMAPNHLLVKYRLPDGQWINIEATSGGHFARDSWVQRERGISAKAIASGIYLQPLSKREAVVAMLSTLMEHYHQNAWYDEMVHHAQTALTHAPNSINALLNLGAAYNKQRVRDCGSKYPTLAEAPVGLRTHCLRLAKLDKLYRDKALELGWHAPTKEEENAYLGKMAAARADRE